MLEPLKTFLRKLKRVVMTSSLGAAFVKQQPVNFRSRDTTPEGLEADVMYAAKIGRGYLAMLAEDQVSLSGKTVLELGPGTNYGSVLILGCYGAQIMVADRYLAPWDARYHAKFYAMLRDWARTNLPNADVSVMEKILFNNGYRDDIITCFASAAEDLAGVPDSALDVIFSNAVLEHVYDPVAAFRNMARVSRSGALGFHQVDFRDHRAMERPLEFLLMNDRDFAREFAYLHAECGNRWRHWQYSELAEQAGFEVLEFRPNLFAEDTYMDKFLPRLQASASIHRSVNRNHLRIVSGLFIVRRK